MKSYIFLIFFVCAVLAANPKRCFPLFSVKVGRTAFVDANFGNDNTAEVEELGCPFKTITEAIQAVAAAKNPNEVWNIKIRPGSYVNGLINLIDGIEIVGSGIDATTIQGRFGLGNGNYTLRDFAINNIDANNAVIFVNDNSRAYISNVKATNFAFPLNNLGVLAVGENAYAEIHSSILEVSADDAFGISLADGGTVIANNIFIRATGTENTVAIRVSSQATVNIRNSVIELFLPELFLDSREAFILSFADSGDSSIVADNNIVSYFSPVPRDSVDIYSLTFVASDAVLSHANVFRDRNNNIDTMTSSTGGAVFITLADFVDIPV